MLITLNLQCKMCHQIKLYGHVCWALLRVLELDNASFSPIVLKGSITFLKWMEVCGMTYRVPFPPSPLPPSNILCILVLLKCVI